MTIEAVPESGVVMLSDGTTFDVTISSSTGNITPNKSGIYFEAPANDAPYETGWTLEYKPVSEGCVKVIRGGKEISIGNPLRVSISSCPQMLLRSTLTGPSLTPPPVRTASS